MLHVNIYKMCINVYDLCMGIGRSFFAFVSVFLRYFIIFVGEVRGVLQTVLERLSVSQDWELHGPLLLAPYRKSVFSLTELGQMNGSVGGGGGGVSAGCGSGGSGGGGASGGSSGEDGEMPAMHEIGEELIWTGRCPPQA